MEEHCNIQYSFTIMMTVVTCNLVKVVCMLLVALQRPSDSLVTLEDALDSFLNEPDITTESCCPAGRREFENESNWHAAATQWKPKKRKWFRAATVKQWYISNLLQVFSAHNDSLASPGVTIS